MTYTDDTGGRPAPAMVLHRLPGRAPPFRSAPQSSMPNPCGRRSINWRRTVRAWASATNNLKPGNLYVTSDGRLIPSGTISPVSAKRHDAEAIRTSASVRARTGRQGQNALRRGTVPLHHAARISGTSVRGRDVRSTGSCGRRNRLRVRRYRKPTGYRAAIRLGRRLPRRTRRSPDRNRAWA